MRIHCIGIGGIGVSSLAQYYLEKGHQVSGSDLVQSEVTDFLQKKGVKIFLGNKPEHIKEGIDVVIHSPAVKPDNPEYMEAKKLGITTKSYPEALGELTKEYDTIAISGSHGKSTTTAMVALALIKAGIDPTVIVGTKLKEFNNSNFRMGRSKYLIIEACEYDSSFVNYFPKIIVVTNIDKEHLDYFKTFSNVVKTFKNFIAKLPPNGFLVVNRDVKGISKIKMQSSKLQFKIQNYSLKQKEAVKIKKILKIPGRHNISNALAVLAVARILGVKDAITFSSLSEYQGSWRRFELKEGKISNWNKFGSGQKFQIISDYGHHPTEVKATLQAAREKYPKKTIWCIFQPHQYQRTYYLFNDFVNVLRQARVNHLIVTDIYDVAGREQKQINAKVSSENLVKKIARKNIQYMPINKAEVFVKENIKSAEVLIIMGAGDIYKLVEKF